MKQSRSERTRAKLIEGAIEVIGREGIANLTHRRLAAQADTSLASTTYHFSSKGEILRAAAQNSLGAFSDLMSHVAQSNPGRNSQIFSDFELAFLISALRDHKRHAAAWAEFFQDSARHQPSQEQSRKWQSGVFSALKQHLPDLSDAQIWASVDRINGALSFALGIGAGNDDLSRLVEEGYAPDGKVPSSQIDDHSKFEEKTEGNKSQKTKEQLISLARETLLEEGAGDVGFRRIARKAGLAATSPAYHFGSPAQLLFEAEKSIVEGVTCRCRELLGSLPEAYADPNRLPDWLAAAIQSEALLYPNENRVVLESWIGAHRERKIPVHLSNFFQVQFECWRQIASHVKSENPPAFAFALFVGYWGQMARILATGKRLDDFAMSRSVFDAQLKQE